MKLYQRRLILTYAVMAGLDPAIHAACWSVDAPLKAGHDESRVDAVGITLPETDDLRAFAAAGIRFLGLTVDPSATE